MSRLKNALNALICRINSWSRPSANDSFRKLLERGEDPEKFIFRDAGVSDATALSRLHVKAFKETHHGKGPTLKIRTQQWLNILQQHEATWFCVVIESQAGELIGFVAGKNYAHEGTPYGTGEINKIYLLQKYHRLGLGKRLLKTAVYRFLGKGIHTILLFGNARNPSNYFYEAMGAQKIYSEHGEFHGGYQWTDLEKLIVSCMNKG